MLPSLAIHSALNNCNYWVTKCYFNGKAVLIGKKSSPWGWHWENNQFFQTAQRKVSGGQCVFILHWIATTNAKQKKD